MKYLKKFNEGFLDFMKSKSKDTNFKDSNYFKSVKEQHPEFENIGCDEDNNILGNCKECGAKGTFVIGHKCGTIR